MKTISSIPLQSVVGERLYAMLDIDIGEVSVYLSDTDSVHDTFSFDEWYMILDGGVVDSDTGRMTINW